jgi:hypothetical protein
VFEAFAILGLTSDLAAQVALVGDVGGSGLYNIVVLPGALEQLPSCLVQSAAFGTTGHEREGGYEKVMSSAIRNRPVLGCRCPHSYDR